MGIVLSERPDGSALVRYEAVGLRIDIVERKNGACAITVNTDDGDVTIGLQNIAQLRTLHNALHNTVMRHVNGIFGG